MVLAIPVDHPVLSIGADLQFKGGDKVRFVGFLGDRSLGGNARQDLQELQVHLNRKRKEDVG